MTTIRTTHALVLADAVESFKVEFLDGGGETPIWMHFRSGASPVSLGTWPDFKSAEIALDNIQKELSEPVDMIDFNDDQHWMKG